MGGRVRCDGRLRESSQYVAGKLHGESLVFHPNGKLQRRTRYEQGAPVGTPEQFDEKGRPLQTAQGPTTPSVEAQAADAAKQSAIRGLMDVARKKVVAAVVPAVTGAFSGAAMPAAPELPSAPELPQAPEVPQVPESPVEKPELGEAAQKLAEKVKEQAAEKAAEQAAEKAAEKSDAKALAAKVDASAAKAAKKAPPPPPPPRKGLILEPPNIGTLPRTEPPTPRGK